MESFDDKAYWQQRHDDLHGAVRAVGIDTLSERSNQLAYQLLSEQYTELLNGLPLPDGATALDAGAGIGAFTGLLVNRGLTVTALDISQVALDGIELPVEKVCSAILGADLPVRGFDYVHSFDVLYHIMDDDEWEASLRSLCRWSKRYVALHERFQRHPQWMPSKIMKLRSRAQTTSVLASEGFCEVTSAPTYFMSKQLLVYRIAALAPEIFYRLDSWALGAHADASWARAIASHHIKVFERR